MVYNAVKSFPVNPNRTSLLLRLIKIQGLKNSAGYLGEGKKKVHHLKKVKKHQMLLQSYRVTV